MYSLDFHPIRNDGVIVYDEWDICRHRLLQQLLGQSAQLVYTPVFSAQLHGVNSAIDQFF